jgi:hypothetical protein
MTFINTKGVTLSIQVKRDKMVTPWKTVPGYNHIRTQVQKQVPGSLLQAPRTIFLAWAPLFM